MAQAAQREELKRHLPRGAADDQRATVELLDDAKLVGQLTALERRTARTGKDAIDHGPGGHDDLVNAAAGALVLAGARPEFHAARSIHVVDGRPRRRRPTWPPAPPTARATRSPATAGTGRPAPRAPTPPRRGPRSSRCGRASSGAGAGGPSYSPRFARSSSSVRPVKSKRSLYTSRKMLSAQTPTCAAVRRHA